MHLQKFAFKLHLLPNMWPVLVELSSVSSEGSWRNKEDSR